MCGLVGVMGNLFLRDKSAFKELLIADTIRGPHSTGVCVVDGDKSMVIKAAISGGEFVSQGHLTEMTGYKYRTTAFIGHNRWASRGIISDENSHPFESEHITLVHNGTLTNQDALDKSAEVDSEAIAIYLSHNGVSETAKLLRGTFALVWHDSERSTVNFLRNSDKPLSIAITANTVFWASEEGMLRWVLGRNNITIKEIFSLPVGVHLEIPSEFKLNQWPDLTEKILLDAGTTVELAPKQYGQQGWNQNWRGGNQNTQKSGTGNSYYSHTNQGIKEVDFIVDSATDKMWLCTDLDDGGELTVSVLGAPDLKIGQTYSGRCLNLATGFVSSFDIEELALSVFDSDDVLDDEVIIVDKQGISLGNLKEIAEKGCQMCNHPMSVDDALEGRFSAFGLMHKECFEEYTDIFGGADDYENQH